MPSPINNGSHFQPIWPEVEPQADSTHTEIATPSGSQFRQTENRGFLQRRRDRYRTNSTPALPSGEPSLAPARLSSPIGGWRVGVEAWVRAAFFCGGGERFGREQALQAILFENTRQRGVRTGRLDLSHHHLSSIPPMYPAWVRHLSVSNNRIRTLNNNLPARLESLCIDRNQLRALPNSWPASLQNLSASDNRLTAIPNNLPSNLLSLNLRNNHIQELSDSAIRMIQSMSRNTVIDLRDNPLSLQTVLRLHNLVEQPNYQGAQIQHPSLLDTYLTRWAQWVSTPLDAHEQRDEAFHQLRTWVIANLPALQSGEDVTGLELVALDLRSLPEDLPQNLNFLNIRDNSITHLPDNLPDNISRLNVGGNRLTSLPQQLPDSLRLLNASGNRLIRLPESLPNGLSHLDVANNRLTQLPQHLPNSLNLIDVSDNQLTDLTENLPDDLSYLDIANNQLNHLPQRLPRALRFLDARGNLITTISDRHLYTTFGGDFTLILTGNPLSQQTVNRLNLLRNNPLYNGSVVHYTNYREGRPRNMVLRPLPVDDTAPATPSNRPSSPHPDLDNEEPHRIIEQVRLTAIPALELGEATASWLNTHDANAAATRRLWQGFADEPGAQEFKRFLNQLRQTINSSDPEFRRSVVKWLKQLASDPQLRKDTFAVSIGASESCQDRISHTFNAMSKLSMAADIARGNYDKRLPDLIKLARGMFRLEQLEGIARETTAALLKTHGTERVDEIEVYLGYQVMLRETLDLPINTKNMAFFNCSLLTQNDLLLAKARVLAAEKKEFASYLFTGFTPWQTVISRLAPEQYEQARNELIEAMGNEFTRRLNTRLQDMALLNDADAEREVGAQLRAEIAREVYGQLTRDFLSSKNMLNLLS